eukprot:jgi/Psemu1/40275/gm1.40275_g
MGKREEGEGFLTPESLKDDGLSAISKPSTNANGSNDNNKPDKGDEDSPFAVRDHPVPYIPASPNERSESTNFPELWAQEQDPGKVKRPDPLLTLTNNLPLHIVDLLAAEETSASTTTTTENGHIVGHEICKLGPVNLSLPREGGKGWVIDNHYLPGASRSEVAL